MLWRPTDPHTLNLIIRHQKQKFIRKTNSYFVDDRAFLRMKEDQLQQTFTFMTYTYPIKKRHVNLLDMRKLCRPIIRWDTLSVSELKNVAKQRGIKGYYKMNKTQLVQHLSDL
jgi:hypothetical protein